MAHQASRSLKFQSMKRIGVFQLPFQWDASPSQGYPLASIKYTCEALRELTVLLKNPTQYPRPGLELRPLAPESNALTMRLPRQV